MGSTAATFDRLLLSARQLYRNGDIFSSTHLPMALHALFCMGATSDKLQDFFDDCCNRNKLLNKPTGQPTEIRADNWRAHLGDEARFHDYQRYVKAIADDKCKPIGDILREHLPSLVSGLVGHAFHPLIRLGHAVQMDDREEICVAIGYWCAANHPLPPVSHTERRPPRDTLDLMRAAADELGAIDFTGNIVDRVGQVLAEPHFGRLFRWPQLAGDSAEARLAEVAALLVRVLASFPTFTLLHTVTSCRALRLLLPYLTDADAAVDQLFYAFACAYVVCGRPQVQSFDDALPDYSWSDILERAVVDKSDHTIKLVHTCWSEFKHYGDGVYQLMAQRCLDNPIVFSSAHG